MMIDYMVHNTMWNEYVTYDTLEGAKAYIAKELEWDPAASPTHFVIYKRERIDA